MLELSSGGLRAGLSEDSLGRRGMDEYQNKRQEGGGATTRSGRATREAMRKYNFCLFAVGGSCSGLASFFFFSSRLLFFRFFSFVSFRRENSDATALVPNG